MRPLDRPEARPIIPLAPDDSRPDLCVIGGGTAGHALAFAAAALGARCTLIDPRPRLGAGQAADLAETMLLAEAAARPDPTPIDLAALRARVGHALATQAANHGWERLGTVGVRLLQGEARFADPTTVISGGTRIRARRFVIAAGAARAVPAWAAGVPPDRRLLRPADLLARDALPPAVDIVACVPGGLEWAQGLRRLGCAVTLRMAHGATDPFDPEALTLLLAALRREKVSVDFVGTPTTEGLSAPVILVLDRPTPAIAGLNLPLAGIVCRDGAPIVDRGFRTTNGRVFAIGDVLCAAASEGPPIPAQIATLLRQALFRLPAPRRAAPAPAVLRTTPGVAQVGAMASTKGRNAGLRVWRFPLADLPRGLGSADAGGAKVVAKASGRILGAVIVGPGAAEAIGAWTLAIARGIPLGDMAQMPLPPDSLGESGRRAALAATTARLRSGLVRRLIAVLRRLP